MKLLLVTHDSSGDVALENERVQGNVSENNETGDTELNSISSSSPTKTKQATVSTK